MANDPLVLFDAARKHHFLQMMRLTGQLQRSAQESGISPSTVHNHLKSDPDFKLAHDEAYGDFKESIEMEVMRRAIMGWEEPVYQQGVLAGTVRKFDSRLLEMLAKRHIPEFKEKYTVEHAVAPGMLAVPAAQSVEDWEKSNEVFEDADIEEKSDDNRETSR